MPFDDAGTSAAQDGAARDRRAVALWLFGMCGMIWVMVALGGATRLTGSGLSIMEWAPLRGALPPLSDAEWQRLYALYQSIPQYELVNKGFGLDGFKRIFWLEWSHRLWGRLIGLAYALPLAWFWLRGRIPAGYKPRLLLLLVLGGLQGAVGWFMVASGFEADRTRRVARVSLEVDPSRRAVIGAVGVVGVRRIDTALDQRPQRGRQTRRHRRADTEQAARVLAERPAGEAERDAVQVVLAQAIEDREPRLGHDEGGAREDHRGP